MARAIIIGFFCLLLATGRCVAAGLETLVAALDAPTLAERDAATARLLSDESISLEQVEHLLTDDSLSWEQRLRLEGVGLALFTRQPRAGLGVQFGTPVEGGAPLNAVIAGFPAAEFLKPGDLVRTIDGQPVLNTAHMGSIILSHSPGDTLTMEIDRPTRPAVDPKNPPPTRPLTLRVPLGRFEDLNNGLPSPERLWAAYRQRLARAGADRRPDPIGGGLSPLAWLRAEGYEDRPLTAPRSRLGGVSAWRVVKLAGQPRSSVSGVELRRGDENAKFRRATIAIQADGAYDQVEETLAAYRAIVGRLVQLQQEKITPGKDAGRGRAVQHERADAERADLEGELVEIVRMLRDDSLIHRP